MSINQETEIVPESDVDDRYSSPTKLLRIASWSYILSWVMLALSVILFVGRVYLQFLDTWNLDLIFAFNWAFYLSSLVGGIVWFVVLQAISEGIYLWMDVEENSRKCGER
jgi:hypothetical protein